MNNSTPTQAAARIDWFRAVKYLTYLLLCFNVYLFLAEELAAVEHTFGQDFSFTDLIQIFSATIDTGAWVILLLLFELETSVLDDVYLQGRLKQLLHGVRIICYGFIGYACYGYLIEALVLYEVVVLQASACSLDGAGWSLLLDLDDYAVLDSSNCAGLTGPLFHVQGLGQVIGAAPVLDTARWLAWTDVINSIAWILVVLVLEWDVRLQLRGQLQGSLLTLSKLAKAVLYAVLFLAAVYWGVAGDFLDFWDAFLWLFAFIFIELNVFSWQAETSAAGPSDTGKPE